MDYMATIPQWCTRKPAYTIIYATPTGHYESSVCLPNIGDILFKCTIAGVLTHDILRATTRLPQHGRKYFYATQ